MSYEFRRKELVTNLKYQGRIKSIEVENAMLKTPRELFLPESLQRVAYIDSPLEIGNGQTISAPHMVAIMCEGLDIKKGQKILEIGTGSGYHAAVIANITGEKGKVYSIERFSNLAENAKNNLIKAKVKNVYVEKGDGSEGLPKYAPYDRIYVTCAAPDIPKPLIDQLKNNGKLMIPVGRRISKLELIEKKDDKILTYNLGGCAFVPLIGKHGF